MDTRRITEISTKIAQNNFTVDMLDEFIEGAIEDLRRESYEPNLWNYESLERLIKRIEKAFEDEAKCLIDENNKNIEELKKILGKGE